MQHESTSCFKYVWDSWDVIDNFVRQNSGLHNLNTKFCMCWHGILHPRATISLYGDIDCVQVVVCCQGKLTNNLLGCLPNLFKVLVIN
jgi:hypothetical protein